MKKDLRTISAEEKEALRESAVEEVLKCHNISKVARDLDINRQVLHSWVNKYNSDNTSNKVKKEKVRRAICKAHLKQVFEIVANNVPYEIEINSIFWSVSSVRKLIFKITGINSSAYLVRRWLLEWGFFKNRNNDLFEEHSDASNGLPVRVFAEQCNMPCYIYWKTSFWSKGSFLSFQCVSSKRGDIRFVRERFGSMNLFLNKIQEIAKRKIAVVYDGNIRKYSDGIYYLSDSVTLFLKSKGKLVNAKG